MRARAGAGFALAAVVGVGALAFAAAVAAAVSPRAAAAAFANELPRAKPVVSFHPRADTPFTLEQLRRALRAGVHGAELDLRWRASDSAVVCSHDARDLADRPTLKAALGAIESFQGSSRSVQGDGLQFYLTLDLKEQGDAYYRAILDALRERASRWSTAAHPGGEPRGITVVVNGSRAAFERAAPDAGIDSLCLIEREDASRRGRILDLSDRDGPLAWVALEYPTTRERIQAIHEGRDAQFGGRFNVRVYGAGRRLAEAIAMGADAVNADFAEIRAAMARVKRPAAPARVNTAAAAAEIVAAGEAALATSRYWTFQGWKVDSPNRARFKAAWRKRASARHARAAGWRGELLLWSETDTTVYEAIERWESRAAWWRYVSGDGARADTSLLDALRAWGTPYSTEKLVELEDRFEAEPIAGGHVRFHHVVTRPGTARAFRRAFLRANDAIRAAQPASRGAALVCDPYHPERLLEIVRWKSEEAWRRFAEAPPPDPEADAALRAATGNLVTRTYKAIDAVP